ncbi:MAG TPA: 16S rRNA (uracil(1498)-N(3))-methyltransferase [Micropepsaceae bacterium]|jgi:16S rRNA (uracil1498-N3)-methyltransferase
MGQDKAQDSASDDLPYADLTYSGGKLRLFVESPLHAGARIAPDEGQAHYLLHVMRAREGQRVLLFNGSDGEWQARIAQVSRRSCVLICETQSQAQAAVPDLWFAFAPIKKTPADYVAQKATELGVRVLQPVFTHRTITRRVNLDRLRANAVEAAEQSQRLSVPEIREPVGLDVLLRSWPAERRLLFCDEGGDAAPVAEALQQAAAGNMSWGILIGPEGGFDAQERAAIRNHPFVLAVSLGPRIMRADTAALAALAVWQAIRGDWGQSRPGL